MANLNFLRVSAIACIVTALTTLGVHFVSFPADTFEARLLLSNNNLYLAHRWMIVLHCICVILSMLGIAFLKWKDGPGWIAFGFLFYTVFGVTEISRMMAVLHYLNPLRLAYLESTDDMTRQALRLSIESFNQVGTTLFSIFALAFTLGNLAYGIVFSGAGNSAKWFGYGFLFWGTMGVLGMVNTFFSSAVIDQAIDLNAKIFQPIFRFALGVWMIRQTWNRAIST